jgi:hypothetical protein
MKQARKQKEAVEAIREVGGVVGYGYRRNGSGKWIQNAETQGPEWLHELLGDDFFANPNSVYFVSYPPVTDAGLEHLRGLAQLQNVYLNSILVTDAGLEHLKGLAQLQELYLTGSHVTDDGVMKLQKSLPKCHVCR